MKYLKLFEDFSKDFSKDLLLREQKLYPNKLISSIANKINDSSDDTLNKLAISGLYRNFFGNIQQIKSKEQLDKLFNEWYDNTMNKMIKTSTFIDNESLAKKYLDAYVKNIKSLGGDARAFSFKKIESGLVDLVNNKGWIKDTSIKQSNDIYNPKDDDIVYEDSDVVILDTNTKAKCVMYGQGESWCITKPELNYYNTYRIKYGATPYFVLQKNIEGNEHKLVIMHYPNGYAIADRSNSGDRAGGNQSSNYPWSYIENEIPNLKGLEKYFTYREITDDERKYDGIIKKAKGYEGDNLQGYIDNAIKGLVINGSKVEAKDFIRDLASEGIEISDNQIKSLREDVIDSLIESGYFLTKGISQSGLLSPKQQLRVVRIKIQNNITLTGDELIKLPKPEINEYISNIDSDGIKYLLTSSKDPEKLMNILGDKGKEYISNLDSDGIEYLLKYSEDSEKVMNTLGYKGKEYISNLDSKSIYYLLNYTKDIGKLIDIMLSNKELISNLDSKSIINLIIFSKDPEKAINILLSNDKLISNLDSKSIDYLLKYSKEPEKVMNILGDKGKEYISNLDSGGIRYLLQYSKDREKVMNILGDKGKELISNLDSDGIRYLLRYSKEPSKVKEVLRKYGHKV